MALMSEGSRDGGGHLLKVQFDFELVMRVYAPRFFVSSQQKFGVTDIKAPWRVTALGGQTML